jgi:Cdc6-like AAA superfamily ATPase
MSLKTWSRESVARFREEARNVEPPAPPAPAISSEGPFHAAAALLTWFELNPTLQPLGRNLEAEREELERLAANSWLVSEAGGRRRWTLKNDVRKAILARLRTRQALADALAANPNRPAEVLQLVLESYVLGTGTLSPAQSAEELTSTLQVIDWLAGTELREQLPSEEQVRRAVEWSVLQRQFRVLVGDHFRGRLKELEALREYVEVLPPQSRGASVRRTFRRIFSLKEKPPLVIWGSGGIGKSTLLAKFILEHSEDPSGLAVVYLDCDRPGLVAREPLTMLVEAVRQLGISYPDYARACQQLRQGWLNRIAEQSARNPGRLRDRSPFLSDFKILSDDMGLSDHPSLLVLDTFEEVQNRSLDAVVEIWLFLEELQATIPALRTVVAGRAPVRGVATEELPLSRLDPDAAEGFLMAYGIRDPKLARTIAEQMRGNPLSLRLAAEVLRLEAPSEGGIADIRTSEWLGKKIDDNRIQGQLYRRILDHVRNPEVRKLAHPGLILRRITPALIEKVLAGPCGLDLSAPNSARALFDALKSEVTLIIPSPTDPLEVYHRSEVRRVMLELMVSEKDPRLPAIHAEAVKFYAGEDPPTPAGRAEEIYHRLWLEQAPADIVPRMLPGVETYLENAVEEVPPSVRPWLASRLGMELELDWNKADLTSWEQYASNRAEELLKLERAEDALELTRKRHERLPQSPLYVLEARALQRLGRMREARQAAATGIEALADNTAVLDLYLIRAAADEVLGDVLDLDSLLATYTDLARRFKDARLVQLFDSYVRLAYRTGGQQSPVIERLRETQRSVLQQIPGEGALGGAAAIPTEKTRPAPDTSEDQVAESVRFGLTEEDRRILLNSLVSLFPTNADLAAATSAYLGVSLAEIAPLPERSVTGAQVVRWAEENGRVPQLISGLLRDFPENKDLQRFRRQPGSAQKPRLTDVPILINRAELRNWVQHLHSGAPPVLVVNGERGSGKSMSIRFLQQASREGDFDLITVRTDQTDADPRDMVERIAFAAGWNTRSMPAKSTSESRYVAEVTDWIGANVQSLDKRMLIAMDDLDKPPSGLIQLVQGLITLSTRVRTLALALLVLNCNITFMY